MSITTFNVSFNATTNGRGNFVVLSAYTTLTPETARVVDGKTYTYYAQSLDGSQWESGSGAYTISTHTLARTSIVANSNGDLNPVNFLAPPVVGMSESPSPSLEPPDMFKVDNLAGLANIVTARSNIYAAPFDALAYSGLQYNGNMDVSQEHAGGVVALVNGSSPYIVDGFGLGLVGSGATANASQAAGLPGYSNCLAIACTATNSLAGASDVQNVYHFIEGYRFSRLGWGAANPQSLTIGFWVFANVGCTIAVAVRNAAATRCYVIDVPVVAGIWQFSILTFPGCPDGVWPTDANASAVVSFCFGAGSGRKTAPNVWTVGTFLATSSTTNLFNTIANFINLTGVVMVPGIEAPTAARAPLIMRPFDQELTICKRYYEKSYDYSVTPGTVNALAGLIGKVVPSNTVANGQYYGSHPYTVMKRVNPTVTIYGYQGNATQASNSNPTDLGANSGFLSNISDQNSFLVLNNSGGSLATGSQVVFYHYVADARM